MLHALFANSQIRFQDEERVNGHDEGSGEEDDDDEDDDGEEGEEGEGDGDEDGVDSEV